MPFGGGGGGGGPTQSTSYQTNLPEYARPFVESMLGATQKQLFEGTPTAEGGFDITGFKPYQPYTGQKTAEFQPLQEEAFRRIGTMGPSSQLGEASGLAGLAGLGALNTGTFGRDAAAQYMSPFIEQAMAPQLREAQRSSDILGTQQAGQAVQAGAFGGSRAGLLEAERQRNLATQMGDIRARGYQTAYEQAANQFNQDMTRRLQGLGTAVQAAGQLGQLGQTQFGQEKDITGMQQQAGAQQQALEQQKINQAMQDYATAQQYPLMQLGFMSNMLRGLPMQAVNTQQYMAQPSYFTQGLGALGTGAMLYNAYKKEGGQIKEYDVGGEVREDLEQMDNAALQRYIKESQSETAKRIAQRILRERGPGMAGGGIIAFTRGGHPGSLMGLELGEETVPVEAATRDQIKEMTLKELQEYNKTGVVPDRLKDVSQPADSGDIAARLQSAGDRGIGGGRTPPAESAAAPASAPAAAPASTPVAAAVPASSAPAESALPRRTLADYYTEPETPQGLLDLQQASDAAKSQARRTQAEHLADIKKEYGELASSKGRQEYRQKVMEERANAKDEARRNRDMLMAQAFADMATRPGPVLVAMMGAVRDRMPDVIANEKDLKKAQREMDKVLFDLNEATRLEELGLIDKATARKENALKKADDLSVKYSTAALDFEKTREQGRSAGRRALATETAADIRAAAAEKAENTRAQARLDVTRQQTEAMERARLQSQLEANVRSAETNLRNAETAIAAQLNRKPAYVAASKSASIPITSESSEQMKAMQAQGQREMERMEAEAKKQLGPYRARLRDAQNRAAGISSNQTQGNDPLGLLSE